jgi:hypothetical protein
MPLASDHADLRTPPSSRVMRRPARGGFHVVRLPRQEGPSKHTTSRSKDDEYLFKGAGL